MQTIGIDVGKRQHIAAICHQGEREARTAVLRFSTDRAGLRQLEDWLARQGQITRAVLESSGHSHLNLAAALQRQGVPVAVVNPIESKSFGKQRLQRTKSDPADARTLAAAVWRNRWSSAFSKPVWSMSHPLEAQGLELQIRQGPGRVLGQGVVDADRDLAP